MNSQAKITIVGAMCEGLLKRKKLYVVSKRLERNNEIILQTFSKKEAYLKADFEAKNKADLSDYVINLTSFKLINDDECEVHERVITEKTLTKTLESKTFKKLKL